MSIKSLTIYCSSSNFITNDFFNLGEKIGTYLAKKSIKIVYGGGKTGIMGKVSSASYISGGEVVGIVPKKLATNEIINTQAKIILVKDMSERKKKLLRMGDAILILPGGSGTIEEATEIISWKILGIHNKNIILFNYKNYWDPLIKLYQEAKIKNFGNKNLQSVCKHVRTFQEFIKIFP